MQYAILENRDGYQSASVSLSEIEAAYGTLDLDVINAQLAAESQRSHGGNVAMWITVDKSSYVMHWSW